MKGMHFSQSKNALLLNLKKARAKQGHDGSEKGREGQEREREREREENWQNS